MVFELKGQTEKQPHNHFFMQLYCKQHVISFCRTLSIFSSLIVVTLNLLITLS